MSISSPLGISNVGLARNSFLLGQIIILIDQARFVKMAGYWIKLLRYPVPTTRPYRSYRSNLILG